VATTAYAILKYRLMDISLIIKKTTAYSLVTSGITFTYVLVVIAFEFLARHIWGYYSFWAAIPAALVIAVTFVPVRERFQKITDQIFFRRMIEYQNVIKEVTRLIVSVTDLNTLFRLIDRTIVRAMCVKNVAVLLLEEGESQYLVEKTNGLPQEVLSIRLPLNSPLASYLKEKKDAVVHDEIQALLASGTLSDREKEALNAACAELDSVGAAVAIPSFTKEKLVGILCLGEKLSGEPYSPDDLELLLTMASEAGIAMENAKLYRDITETRDYLNSLVQGSVDAIITMDLNGSALTWNEGARSIFGYDSSEVIGNIPPFFSAAEVKDLTGKVLRAEDVKAVEIHKKNKEGIEIPLLLTLSPIRNPEGKIIGISGILKDITELKKVDQLKHEFLAVISHELRTPLTPIKGYLALLLGGKLGEFNKKQEEAFKIILSQSNHLHDLIDSVIDISRIEAGRPLEVEKEPLFIDDVVKESVEASRPVFEAKEIKIQVSFPAKRITLMADRKKLLRVMDNLLGNATRFTPYKGTMRVLTEAEDGRVKITVADSGIGIAPQHFEKIFESFYQVDSSFTRASGGLGMGLSIAREIIEAHGGKIWAESEGLGKGSRFIFILPFE
jgi:PAS domain S-box-containing protein